VVEISEPEAVRIAQEECARRGIPWREPYSVRKRWPTWQVDAPSDRRGGNAVIYVSRKHGSSRD
jgi:hypothetical protein